MRGGQFQGCGGAAAGLGRIAPLKGQPGQLGLDFRLLFGQRLKALDGRRGLASRLQAGRQAQGSLVVGRGFRLVDLCRLLVAAVHEQRMGLGKVGSRSGKRNDEQNEDEGRHAP